MKYAIRWNENEGAYTCGQCGEWLNRSAGPEIFSYETDDPICRECGRKWAPELEAMLDAYQHRTERGPDSEVLGEAVAGDRNRQTRRVRRFVAYRVEHPAKGLMVRIEDHEEASDGSLLYVAVSEATRNDEAVNALQAVLFAVSGLGSEGLNQALAGPLGRWPGETA